MTIPISLLPDERIPYTLKAESVNPDYTYFRVCIQMGLILSTIPTTCDEVALYYNVQQSPCQSPRYIIGAMALVRYCIDNNITLTIYYENQDHSWTGQEIL